MYNVHVRVGVTEPDDVFVSTVRVSIHVRVVVIAVPDDVVVSTVLVSVHVRVVVVVP